MHPEKLCPFSKPLIGNWCRCEHARLAERCSGKMVCGEAGTCLDACTGLVDRLRDNARFVLGISETETDLTHAQSMKIRCGGLRGMQSVMQLSQDTPVVTAVIAAANTCYGSLEDFPFNEILQDIRAFSHRKKART